MPGHLIRNGGPSRKDLALAAFQSGIGPFSKEDWAGSSLEARTSFFFLYRLGLSEKGLAIQAAFCMASFRWAV
jgi:hypothetical protein